MSATARLELSYVLPLRWSADAGRSELRGYLGELAEVCAEVIVVDGSPPEVFAANAAAWEQTVTHIPPDGERRCKMGKVAGVLTGVSHARHEPIVLADDDVRYDRDALARVIELLQEFDLVRPQNFFGPLPWHARWDTARTLLNRALGGDFPGTLAVRRSRMAAMGGYDGDVMFENLELMRTVEAHGGRTLSAPEIYVRRIPPTAAHFWGQRTRQAYDDFAIPLRMCCWLAVLPATAAAVLRGRASRILQAIAAAAFLAEHGRRRAGGTRVFPASSSLLAGPWLLERGVCAWLAVLQRVRFGGVRYGEGVIPTAAHSKRWLRRRALAVGTAGSARYAAAASSAGSIPTTFNRRFSALKAKVFVSSIV